MKKRKPRGGWQLQHDTDDSLITAEEAEALLNALENSVVGKAASDARADMSQYLLTGLLREPDEKLCWGSANYYRICR